MSVSKIIERQSEIGGLSKSTSLYEKKPKKILLVENGKQLTKYTSRVKKSLITIMSRALCECVSKFFWR